MKYKHRKSGVIVEWNQDDLQYTNINLNFNNERDIVWLNKDMVEDSADWVKLCMDIKEIKKLQNIPCLSINDIARVYVTANRFKEWKGERNEYDLEKPGRELLEIVKEKLNK